MIVCSHLNKDIAAVFSEESREKERRAPEHNLEASTALSLLPADNFDRSAAIIVNLAALRAPKESRHIHIEKGGTQDEHQHTPQRVGY